jgi:hypothetical protein
MLAAMRRVRTWLIAFALLLIAAVVLVWTQRKSIATGYVDGLLSTRKVPARYRIAELGFGLQRLTDVSIGDPTRPDLVADWILVETGIGFDGPFVTGVKAGKVRLRGRLVDGRVSLGTLDRLLPAPSGKPFALPKYDLAISDGRMRLETPAGLVGAKLTGRGRLDNGFRGTIALFANRLAGAGCAAQRVSFYGDLAIDRDAPRLAGPVRVASAICGGVAARDANAAVEVSLGEALDRWRGKASLAVADVRGPSLWLKRIGGGVDFAGSAAATGGTMRLTAGPAAAFGAGAGALRLNGQYRISDRTMFAGDVSADRASLPAPLRARILASAGSAAGTPVAPLLDQAARAAAAAGRDMSMRAAVSATLAGGAGRLQMGSLDVRSATGAYASLANGSGVSFGWPNVPMRLDGALSFGGGGLPVGDVRLGQAAAGGPIAGTARLQPYRAGAAELALTPVEFRLAGPVTRFSTRATLSGPLGDGRIDRASMALSGLWDGRGRVRINPGCAPLTFDRLAMSGLVLSRSAVSLCPTGNALVSIDGARVGGGARLPATRVRGSLGGSALSLAVRGGEIDLARPGFRVTGVETEIGSGERVSELRIAELSGTLGRHVGGRFTGAAGQISKVPLLMSDAVGDWSLAAGRLAVAATATVSDAAEASRFEPLATRDLRLVLARGQVDVTGTLVAPATGIRVADVVIAHDLGRGSGRADLSVPGIAFNDALQPSNLTRLTRGVIADVRGTVSGRGQIRWTPAGVTSDGRFRTDGTDLAAAVGPVTGIKGEIEFTDLLALESASGQSVTIASINPGVPVNNGTIRYRTLANSHVQIEGGRWPFAGGELLLDPTLMDFSQPVERRMTFHVRGLDAAQFLQTFEYKNLNATGTFDGTLPMTFDTSGGRIKDGRLAVREGGGTLQYVGEISKENLGTWGNIAFDALRSLRYRNLTLVMNGPLAGEMVTQVRFAGISQGEGAKSNFIVRRLARLPFVFNIRIEAPFRALIDSARSFYDPNILIQRNLPTLIDEQKKALVQPPVSGPVPQEKPD